VSPRERFLCLHALSLLQLLRTAHSVALSPSDFRSSAWSSISNPAEQTTKTSSNPHSLTASAAPVSGFVQITLSGLPLSSRHFSTFVVLALPMKAIDFSRPMQASNPNVLEARFWTRHNKLQ
jgi:hypothetical protein